MLARLAALTARPRVNSGRVVVDTPAAALRQSGVDLRQHLGIY